MDLSELAEASEFQGVTDGYLINKNKNKFESKLKKQDVDKVITYDT